MCSRTKTFMAKEDTNNRGLRGLMVTAKVVRAGRGESKTSIPRKDNAASAGKGKRIRLIWCERIFVCLWMS